MLTTMVDEETEEEDNNADECQDLAFAKSVVHVEPTTTTCSISSDLGVVRNCRTGRPAKRLR